MHPRKHTSWRQWGLALIGLVFCGTLAFNLRNEALGPAGSGVTFSGPSLHVIGVAHDSAMEHAGVRAGDSITAVDGRIVRGQPDWFVVRANFELNRAITVDISRAGTPMQLSMTLTKPNWQTFTATSYLPLAARVALLVIAAVFVRRFGATTVAVRAALAIAMTAVAEGFPSAGWAAALRHLPVEVALPIAVTSVSWLLLGPAWLALALALTDSSSKPRLARAVLLVPTMVFGAPIVATAKAMLCGPPVLCLPQPLVDSLGSRLLLGVFGVNPELFLSPWFQSAQAQMRWMVLWFVSTVAFLVAGLVWIGWKSHDADSATRRRGRLVVTTMAVGIVLGAHNVLIRNWRIVFASAPPMLFARGGYALEALAFVVTVIISTAAFMRTDR